MNTDSTAHQDGHIAATLFDFSGTLFRLEESDDWTELDAGGLTIGLNGRETAETADSGQ